MSDAHADAHAEAHDTHHAPVDPNAAPMHQDVRSDFPDGALAFAWILGAVAIIAGIILGVTVVNN